MIIQFTKQFVAAYCVGHFEPADGSLYSVSSNDKAVGEILISKKKSYLKIFTETWFIKDNYIFTETSKEKSGQFRFSQWVIFIRYVDKLFLGKKRFLFKRMKAGARFPFFNIKGRGNFKFRLSGTMEYINYSFKIDTPLFSVSNPYLSKEFSGKIELNEADYLPAVCGLFLVERALKLDAI